jgi:hypothetical protein
VVVSITTRPLPPELPVQEHRRCQADGFGEQRTELRLEFTCLAIAQGDDIRGTLAARQRRH